jgi:hypothetical protein
MADSAVAVTAGSGTNIDTRTEGTNGNHRQVVVLGDPATNAGVAPVDATAGLKVDLGADNDVTITSGTVTTVSTVTNVATIGTSVTPGTSAAHLGKAEDAAHASGDTGVAILGVRRDTPASGAGTDGDYATLNLNSSGRLYTSATVDTALPAGTNNIGDVDVLTVPTDPFGANADAASATGSISAKLRAMATALGTTALDLGVGTGGSRTLRVAIDSAQLDGSEYETVAASQTAQTLGATGATGDYISKVVIIPATTSPGNVLLLDNATSITIFAGGASSVTTLHPFTVDLGMFSVSGAWKITTGANVSAIGIGNFT